MWWKKILKTPSKSTIINDLIKNYEQKNAEKPITSQYSNRTPQNGNLERRGILKYRISCSMSNMLQISKTKRDLWLHTTNHQRKNQESNRTTNQQWIYHVRPWNSQIVVDKHSKSWRYENSAESQKNRDYLDSAKTPLRPMPNAHARTKIHALRHGRTWQNNKWKDDVRRKSDKPYRERNSDTVKNSRTLWIQIKNTKEKETRDQIILKTRWRPMVIVVIMDTHSSTSSWWEYSPSRTWQQCQ